MIYLNIETTNIEDFIEPLIFNGYTIQISVLIDEDKYYYRIEILKKE